MFLLVLSLASLLSAMPTLMYAVYAKRRLGTRQQLLRQNIMTLGLDDAYMRVRHGHEHPAWRRLPAETRRADFDARYFGRDFKAETSFHDFLLPVLLLTLLSGIGWFVATALIVPLQVFDAVISIVPQSFMWGFAGAFMAGLHSILEDFRKYTLFPNTYYACTYRLLFSSTAAFLVTQPLSALGIGREVVFFVAFGIGLFPIEKTWAFIAAKTAEKVGATRAAGELGEELAKIQGLEDTRVRQKLVDVGVTSIQALATSDPLLLFFHTTFPIRTVVDLVDKAILYTYIGDRVANLRCHGINGVIELVALAKLMSNIPAFGYAREDDSVEDLCPLFLSVNAEHLINDVANGLSMSDDELKAFIYNMYYDPVVCFIYDVWGRYLYVAPPQEDTTDDGRRIQGALPVHPVTPPIQPVGAALNN